MYSLGPHFNEKWRYENILCSTNTAFYKRVINEWWTKNADIYNSFFFLWIRNSLLRVWMLLYEMGNVITTEEITWYIKIRHGFTTFKKDLSFLVFFISNMVMLLTETELTFRHLFTSGSRKRSRVRNNIHITCERKWQVSFNLLLRIIF